MRRTILVCLVAFLPFSSLVYEANAYSDWTGIYARVDKVIFEPDATAPERIQIWGAFALAKSEDRNSYDTAERGYLYFACKPGDEAVCRKEWADLKAIAGTDQIVGFGNRSQARPRLRKAKDKAGDPDQYPLNAGLFKVTDRRSAYSPIRELKALPKEQN